MWFGEITKLDVGMKLKLIKASVIVLHFDVPIDRSKGRQIFGDNH